MNRISNTDDLRVELQGLLESAQQPRPSRARIAAKLLELADATMPRRASALKPSRMAPIEYTYNHPVHGQLTIVYSGHGEGWYVQDAGHVVRGSRLMPGLRPMDHRNVATMLQRAVDQVIEKTAR